MSPAVVSSIGQVDWEGLARGFSGLTGLKKI